MLHFVLISNIYSNRYNEDVAIKILKSELFIARKFYDLEESETYKCKVRF